jgi:prepilin-type N-terminal cleavage/methylation domain-containing protein
MTGPIVSAKRHSTHGFTLVEIVVSLSVMSILMLAMGSALLVATKALPDAERTTTKLNQASQIAEQITTELQEARHITERNGQAVTFTVADRDGDGSPERIRYAWSGTAGDPLTRQYNFGTAVTVLADMSQFSLTYDLHTDLEQYPGFPVYGSEVLLNSYTAAEDLSEYEMKASDWIGQYFQPPGGVFPADAVYWRVTRLKFEAMVDDAPYESTYVQLRLPDTEHEPTDTIIEQQVMYEGDLTDSWEWQEFFFSGAHDLVPGADLCLVLEATGQSGKIRWEDDDAPGATGRLKTENNGNSWEYKTDECMRYEIYGQVATPGADQTAARQYVTGIQLQLQSGADADTRIDTAVHLPNTPELLSAVWELDFDTDPTALNMNGDASSDWNLRSGSFDPDDLVNGIWVVDGASTLELDTLPDNSFTELTTIDLRFRCTEISGSGAYFWINADYTGGNFMPIVVTIDKLSDSTQTTGVKVGGTDVALVSGMSTDFVDVRLLIDPDLDTVNIKINEMDQGTFAYTPYAPSTDPQCATLYEWGSDAEWDDVRIRVGGNNP